MIRFVHICCIVPAGREKADLSDHMLVVYPQSTKHFVSNCCSDCLDGCIEFCPCSGLESTWEQPWLHWYETMRSWQVCHHYSPGGKAGKAVSRAPACTVSWFEPNVEEFHRALGETFAERAELASIHEYVLLVVVPRCAVACHWLRKRGMLPAVFHLIWEDGMPCKTCHPALFAANFGLWHLLEICVHWAVHVCFAYHETFSWWLFCLQPDIAKLLIPSAWALGSASSTGGPADCAHQETCRFVPNANAAGAGGEAKGYMVLALGKFGNSYYHHARLGWPPHTLSTFGFPTVCSKLHRTLGQPKCGLSRTNAGWENAGRCPPKDLKAAVRSVSKWLFHTDAGAMPWSMLGHAMALMACIFSW